jgi:peptidoglycan hydrolase-like protein with peptidoglycan-binding domain/uncharacterized tellurite resistance protein B-like protein
MVIAAPQPAGALTKPQVVAAQQALTSLGYSPGTADGTTGKQTRAAIRRFQRNFGLRVTGVLDDETLAALNLHQEAPPQPQPGAVGAPQASDSASGDTSGGSGVLIAVVILGVAIAIWRSARKTPANREAQAIPAVRPQSTLAWAPSQPRGSQTTSFAISASQRARSPSERAAESQQCWLPAGQQITVGNYLVPSGLLYVGMALSRSDGLGIENCLINPSLTISVDSRDDHGDRMAYYPSYAFIEPACRASYLNWLAGGKVDPGICIGYVFLYFYGLERRLFLDEPDENEASAIVAEVIRLRMIYGNNHSFARYSSALLDAAAIKNGNFENSCATDLRKSGWEIPLGLRAEIGRSIANGDNLTAPQMLAWYCTHPDRRLPPSILAKCPDEFRQLFAARFAQKFPQGLKVPIPARKLSAIYKAASGSFSVQIKGAYQLWPDIIGLTAPLSAIQPLIDGCIEELQPYARRIGQKTDKRGALETALALPRGLNNPTVTAPIQALKQFCESALTGAVSVVSPAELLRAAGVIEKVGDKFGKSEMGMLSLALAHCGFGMEPDPRSNYTKVDDDDLIALFRLPAGSRSALSAGYAAAAVLVDLGAAVATADGVFSLAELETIQKRIGADANLSAEERHRLMARTAFRARKPALLRDFKKLATESPEQRGQLARFAVSIAAADNRLAVEEVRVLEKLYRTLDLTETQLYSDLQTMGANAAELSATIAPAPSLSRPTASNVADYGIALDPRRLARTREETARVSALLAQVFSDEGTPQQQPSESQPAAPVNDMPMEGLDTRYRSLVQMLFQHDTISRSEFDDLAHDRGVLPDGAIEAINDWAYSKFDQPFLEDGDPVMIDRSLLQSKKEDA